MHNVPKIVDIAGLKNSSAKQIGEAKQRELPLRRGRSYVILYS